MAALSESKTGTLPKGWEEDEEEEVAEIANQTEDDAVESDEQGEDDKNEPEPLDWTIVLIDGNGERASLPLSHDQALYPQIQAVTRRASFLEDTDPAEVLLRRYTFAMQDFVEANPAFDPSALSSISFVFDRSDKGAIVLDDVAIAAAVSNSL